MIPNAILLVGGWSRGGGFEADAGHDAVELPDPGVVLGRSRICGIGASLVLGCSGTGGGGEAVFGNIRRQGADIIVLVVVIVTVVTLAVGLGILG